MEYTEKIIDGKIWKGYTPVCENINNKITTPIKTTPIKTTPIKTTPIKTTNTKRVTKTITTTKTITK